MRYILLGFYGVTTETNRAGVAVSDWLDWIISISSRWGFECAASKSWCGLNYLREQWMFVDWMSILKYFVMICIVRIYKLTNKRSCSANINLLVPIQPKFNVSYWCKNLSSLDRVVFRYPQIECMRFPKMYRNPYSLWRIGNKATAYDIYDMTWKAISSEFDWLWPNPSSKYITLANIGLGLCISLSGNG